ncbi:hypothetical protein BDN72DRAFT_955984 [Pluteus cervinus]|uniref:Uncharacterized protein n=1 Tax=Pluteus cervinus TaxID=181527 RepID=A0ACD3B983_9AGAR|nr:hypothetical protein BDN72DRAFT_955984 [Pluteus cervinus]
MNDPNFPDELDITPSSNTTTNGFDPDGIFGQSAQKDAIQKYGIAGRVWEAAYVLISYAQLSQESRGTWSFDPPFWGHDRQQEADRLPFTMVELGAGLGIVSAAISAHLTPQRDIIIATDLPEVCPLLENMLGEHSPTLSVRPLAWGNQEHVRNLTAEYFTHRPLTHIICSDLVYFPELLAPLLRTLLCLTTPSTTSKGTSPAKDLFLTPEVVISYKTRSLPKETPFWSTFGLWFEYHPVLVQQSPVHQWEIFHGSSQVLTTDGDDIFVFVGRRRCESMYWTITEDDGELMSGVGAGGTSGPKVDGTFESLLLMSLDYGN